MMDKLILSVRKLPKIDMLSLNAYKSKRYEFLEKINNYINNYPDFSKLTGNVPSSFFYDIHRYHISFMSIIMQTGDYELMVKNLPWYYRTYHNQGIKYEYFRVSAEGWITILNEGLPKEYCEKICAIYRWMIESHDELILLSQIEDNKIFDHDEASIVIQQHLFKALIEGNRPAAKLLFDEHVSNWRECEVFFNSVIYPAMVRIGLEWENGHIPMATEHLATAIVHNLLSSFYFQTETPSSYRGSAVVTAAPNEYHEMGAWMVASALEMDGWNVKYLGSGTPINDILSLLREIEPEFIAISMAIVIHLESLIEIIEAIRADDTLNNIKIMIGGQAFARNPELIKMLRADAYLKDNDQAVMKAREWQNIK